MIDLKTASEEQMNSIIMEAREAGIEAGLKHKPTPMAVQSSALGESFNFNKPYEVVEDGVCGFAWVVVKPATSRFARYLKKTGIGRPDSYMGGITISPHATGADFNQSMERKEAWGTAFANVLSKYGIRAYMTSRID